MLLQEMLEDKIEQLKKARETCIELENDIYDSIESTYAIKEELLEVLETVIENVDQFEDVESISTIIAALSTKPVQSKSSKKKKKHGGE